MHLGLDSTALPFTIKTYCPKLRLPSSQWIFHVKTDVCTRGFFYTFFLHANGIAFVTRTDTFILDIFDSQRRTE